MKRAAGTRRHRTPQTGRAPRPAVRFSAPTPSAESDYALLGAILDAMSDGLLAVDLHGHALRYNQSFLDIFRLKERHMAAPDLMPARRHVARQLRLPQKFLDDTARIYGFPEVPTVDFLEFNDGRIVERISIPHRLDGTVCGRVWSFRDVTDRLSLRTVAERRLARLEQLWHLVAEAPTDRASLAEVVLAEGTRVLGMDGGTVCHPEGDALVIDFLSGNLAPSGRRFPYANSTAKIVLDSGAVVDIPDLTADPAYADLVPTRQGIRSYVGMPIASESGTFVLGFFSSKVREKRMDADDVPYIGLLAAFFARQIRSAEQDREIARMAYHDPLTGLPNRLKFLEELNDVLALSKRRKRRGALLYLDLDHFKEVNDTAGHAVGDHVLVEAASRLAATVRREDLLARIGGDEFVVLVREVGSAESVDVLARRIRSVLSVPFRSGDQSYYLSASMGIVLFPDDSDTADKLMTFADAAMYRAKEDGRNAYRFYSAAIADRIRAVQEIQESLHRALDENEFELYYQPIINVMRRRVVGFEALLRWHRPGYGIVAPGEFIGVAEDSGLMLPIGEWVLTDAFTQAARWQQEGEPLRVAINVSARQFCDPGFLRTLRGALSATNVDCRLLSLEITESAAMRDPDLALTALHECRRQGIEVVLDGFGTAYSSFAYLKRLPIDLIKLDQLFVRDVPGHAQDEAIVRAIIALGRGLRCDLVAEGVERIEQARWLLEQGCSMLQGRLIAEPMPAPDVRPWLAQGDVRQLCGHIRADA